MKDKKGATAAERGRMPQKIKRPLKEMEAVAKQLRDDLEPFRERIENAGSIRRRMESIGDVEVVAIPHREYREIKPTQADMFLRQGRLDEVSLLWEHLDVLHAEHHITYHKRGDRYRQFALSGVQVDVFTAVPASFGLILMIRTGSAEFSKHMVTRLKVNGYCSRDGRVYRLGERNEPTGDPIPTPEEKDVFELAKEAFLSPEKRSW